MQVSVIIPVYNAGAYVRQAVESALAQPETAEVVLVEDGSPDDSWAVCQALATEYEKVSVYRHPNGENRGAGATRNLALRHATGDLIAFLDADDFFLPGHLALACDILAADSTLDGVYGAIGVHFEFPPPADFPLPLSSTGLTTMSRRVAPEALFETLVGAHIGYFSIISLVVRRAVFDRVGEFDTHLRLYEDTVMLWKLAALARLAPGSLDKPVAMRRVHPDNRILAPRPPAEKYYLQREMWRVLWQWGNDALTSSKRDVLLDQFLRFHMYNTPTGKRPHQLRLLLATRVRMVGLAVQCPSVMKTRLFWLRFFRLKRLGHP